jgi:uronate dehydrogenase
MTDSNLDRPAAQKPFRRLLLTGAAGNLGKQLRGALAAWADVVRVTDIARGGARRSIDREPRG